MMVRYSELRAKREEMEKELDPRRDIEEPLERGVQNEVGALREVDVKEVKNRGSVGNASVSRLRRSERDR